MKKALSLIAAVFAALAASAAAGDWSYRLADGGGVVLTALDKSTKGAVSVPSVIGGRTVTALDGTFRGCTKITSVTIPASVGSIGAGTFRQCTKLTAVVFEDAAAAVDFGSEVFLLTPKLKTLVVPLGSTFADGSLAGSAITKLELLDSAPGSNLDGVLMHRNAKGAVDVKVKEVVIPHGADLVTWRAALRDFVAVKGHTFSRQNPRAWIQGSAEGDGYLKVGGKKYYGTAAFKAGVKVQFVSTAAAGYTAAGVGVTYSGGAAVRYGKVSGCTVTMPEGDIVFAPDFVSAAEESARLDEVAASLALTVTGGGSTIDGVECAMGYVNLVFSEKLEGLGDLLTKSTVKLDGAGSGLGLYRHDDGEWYLEGVPKAEVSFSNSPAYVTVTTLGGYTRIVRLNLAIDGKYCFPAESRYLDVCASSDSVVHMGVEFDGYEPTSLPEGFSYTAAARKLTIIAMKGNIGYHTIAFRKPVTITGTGKDAYSYRYAHINVKGDRFWSSDSTLDAFAGPFDFMVGSSVKLTLLKGLTLSGLPAGLKYTSKTGVVSGTPTSAGETSVVISRTVFGEVHSRASLWRVKAKDWSGITAGGGSTMPGQALNDGVVSVLAGVAFPKSSGTYKFVMGDPKATVKVSGLPAGLSLVKTAAGEYVIAGRATAAGESLVKVTATANGVAKTSRIAYRVLANPLAGSYRGFVLSAEIRAMGDVTMKVAESGLATISINEGSSVTRVTAYPSFVDGHEWDAANPLNCDFELVFPIAANKTLKTAARTARLYYRSFVLNGVLDRRMASWGGITCNDGSTRGESVDFYCYPAMTKEALEARSYYYSSYRFGATTYACTGDDEDLHDIIATAKFDWDKANAAVSVRLPAGGTYTATLPIVADYCCASDGVDWELYEQSSYRAFIIAPFVAKDADGTYYRIPLQCDATESGKPDDLIAGFGLVRLVWTPYYRETFEGGESGECGAFQYRYGVRPGKTFAVSPADYLPSGGNLRIAGESGETSFKCVSFADGIVEIENVGESAYRYDAATGRLVFSFTSGRATYTFDGVAVSPTGRGDISSFRGMTRTRIGAVSSWRRSSLVAE